MRVVQNEQMTIGEVDIAKINFNYKSIEQTSPRY